MNLTQKIELIGLGPVGMILAAHLKEAGLHIAICESDKLKMNLIRREGVRLEGVIRKNAFFEHTFTSIEDMKDFAPDVVVLCVKSYHLQAVVRLLRAYGNENLILVCAMNGLDIEQMVTAEFPDSSVLRMVINFAGNINAPNVVKVTFFNPPNYIASLDDSQVTLAEQFSGCLTSVNLETKSISSFELLRRVWEKTILNAALSPLCAIARMTMREAMAQPDTQEIVEQTILEGIDVAEAEKITFEDDFIRKCLRYLKKAGDHFPSLAVDVLNNRPTEIDYMNGKIVEYGRKHYIRTPLNLLLTNVITGITHQHVQKSVSALRGADGALSRAAVLSGVSRSKPSGNCFVGVDIGSALTKITVIDETEQPIFQTSLKTMNPNKVALRQLMDAVFAEFPVALTCATGYGRKHFPDSDIIKTEINCAAEGVSYFYPNAKTIIDIGGEDIKIIRCDEHGTVENFYLSNKCAAGTGVFLTEIAEKVDVPVGEMSAFAEKSSFEKELNSFCTVFAKTEVTGWIMDGVPVTDLCKGIYLSIANRVIKMRIEPTLPVHLIGGVINYHPYLKNILEEKLHVKVNILQNPLYGVSFGAALMAKRTYALQHEAQMKDRKSNSL